MISSVRIFVFLFVAVFTGLAVFLAVGGDLKASTGELIFATLIAPLLVEAWRPRKYFLRKPKVQLPDNLLGRLKQFRIDHAGPDGTFILAVATVVALAYLASAIFKGLS